MKRLHAITSAAEVVLVNATTAPFPPVAFGAVPSSWGDVARGVVPEFDLDLAAAGASGSLTVVRLYGGKLSAFVNADDDFTATHGTETFTAAAHGLTTGDGPFRVSSSGTLPAGLEVGVDYWIIYVDANNFKLAASFADAGAGTAVPISDNGTGTHTLADTADTKRLTWHRLGEIEASLSLAAREGYTVRCDHDPRFAAYAVAWTGTASNALRAAMAPVEER